MLRAAIVGVGFMGWIHYLAYQRSTQAKLAAFCSRNPKKRAGDWTGIQGNFGPPGEQIATEGLRVYETLEEVVADPDIDLIDICLPPNLHVDAACKALRAGKHVICEKPLGLNTADCDLILDEADKANRCVLTAQVLPYMGEFEYAYQLSRSQEYGRPVRAHLKRVISPPDWIPNFYEAKEVGGPLIDLHVHDTHFVRLLFGMPTRVMCSATLHQGLVRYCHTLMEFEDKSLSVSTASGVSDQTARPFCHGFEIQFEQSVVQFELAATTSGVEQMPLMRLGMDGKVEKPELPQADEIAAFAAEIDDAARSIQTGSLEPRLDGRYARDAIHLCQCLQESAETGQWISC